MGELVGILSYPSPIFHLWGKTTNRELHQKIIHLYSVSLPCVDPKEITFSPLLHFIHTAITQGAR